MMADKVGITPWEIRYRNAIRPGETLPNGQIVDNSTGDVYKRQVLMKDREVLVCDEAKVMADCRQAAKELADDING